METSQPYFTATIVFEYTWKVDERSRPTSTYTTTYINSAGNHTAYAVVANTALPSPLKLETVGIPYSIAPDGLSPQHVSATVATHFPTTSTLNPSLISAISDLSVRTSSSTTLFQSGSSDKSRSLLHGKNFMYFQIIIFCIFCGGCLFVRRARSRCSQDDRLEQGWSSKTDIEQAKTTSDARLAKS